MLYHWFTRKNDWNGLLLNGSRLLALRQVQMVVLDEADRIIDLGFEPDIQYIFSVLHNVASFCQ